MSLFIKLVKRRIKNNEIVKLLIPVSDPKVKDNCALYTAARNGYIDIVKLLIPVSNPKIENNYALRYVAEKGYTEIVKLLMPILK